MGVNRRCGYRGSCCCRRCRLLADWRRTKGDGRDRHAVDPIQTERANGAGSARSTSIKARRRPAADKRAVCGARAPALARSLIQRGRRPALRCLVSPAFAAAEMGLQGAPGRHLTRVWREVRWSNGP